MYFIFEIPIIYIFIIIAMILGLIFVGFVGLIFWIQAHLTAIITVIGIINAILFILGMIITFSPEEDGTKDSAVNCFFSGIFLGLIASAVLDIPLYLIYRILMFIASIFGIV